MPNLICKLPDLDVFNRGQIVVSRVYQEYMDGGQKTRDKANFTEQLALKERDERRLRRIVLNQRRIVPNISPNYHLVE
ncbi:hypothetical protein TNCV_2433221 [Trichonephila clavipes]|nr:hypothetical protein TNCV_2433221 [Trichonephila clavipes]